jgi:hypothetical protein
MLFHFLLFGINFPQAVTGSYCTLAVARMMDALTLASMCTAHSGWQSHGVSLEKRNKSSKGVRVIAAAAAVVVSVTVVATVAAA